MKFKLLKPLPGHPIDSIFEKFYYESEHMLYVRPSNWLSWPSDLLVIYPYSYVLEYPDFFEPIEEPMDGFKIGISQEKH